MKTLVIGSGSHIYKQYHHSPKDILIKRDLSNLNNELLTLSKQNIPSKLVYYSGHSRSISKIDLINYEHLISTITILENLKYRGHFIYISSTITEVEPKRKAFKYYKKSRIFGEKLIDLKIPLYTIVKIGVIAKDKRSNLGKMSRILEFFNLQFALGSTYITYPDQLNDVLTLEAENQKIILATNEQFILGKH